jgi:release factor glutamine methyltransferase
VDSKILELGLCKGVYEPREDSYLLARVVQEHAFGKVLDLGTGTGIQGITAALKGCKVTFADIDQNSLECAERNARLNCVEGEFVRSDIFSCIKGRFNTIIFNPPYLESSGIGDVALDGGAGGRLLIERFLDGYKEHLMADHIVLLLESSINSYEKDVKRLKAEIVGKEHYFFEDLVVLLFG